MLQPCAYFPHSPTSYRPTPTSSHRRLPAWQSQSFCRDPGAVVHAGGDVEEAAYPGRRAGGDNRVERLHGATRKRWSSVGGMNNSPSSLYVLSTKWVMVAVTRSIVASFCPTKSATSCMLRPATTHRRSCAPDMRYTERTSANCEILAATLSKPTPRSGDTETSINAVITSVPVMVRIWSRSTTAL